MFSYVLCQRSPDVLVLVIQFTTYARQNTSIVKKTLWRLYRHPNTDLNSTSLQWDRPIGLAVECSPMAWEIGVQSQVKSYQSLKKWYLTPPCLTLSIIKYVSRIKWSNPGKGVAPFPTPQFGSYWKGSFRLAFDYGRQLYFTLREPRINTSKKKKHCRGESKFTTFLSKHFLIESLLSDFTRLHLHTHTFSQQSNSANMSFHSHANIHTHHTTVQDYFWTFGLLRPQHTKVQKT